LNDNSDYGELIDVLKIIRIVNVKKGT
jgi:hypothetical protein